MLKEPSLSWLGPRLFFKYCDKFLLFKCNDFIPTANYNRLPRLEKKHHLSCANVVSGELPEMSRVSRSQIGQC